MTKEDSDIQHTHTSWDITGIVKFYVMLRLPFICLASTFYLFFLFGLGGGSGGGGGVYG